MGPAEETVRWLQRARTEVLDALAQVALPEDRPTTIYHYTGPAGVIGILSDQKMRLSHAYFLNDTTEVGHGHSVFAQVLASIADHGDPVQRAVALRSLQTLSTRDRAMDIFVACFCENGDSDHLWKMYGGEEGFSLGLSVWDIPDLHSGIRKVVYGQAEHAAAAHASLGVAFGRVHQFAETFGTARALQHVDEFAGWIVPAAAFGSAAFKSSDWKDEEEWRIVVLQPRKGVAPGLRREPVKFRLSDRGIVPYISLPLVAENGPNAGRLPVTEVYLGPTSDVDVKANGLTRLLEENGYSARTTTIRASRGSVAGAEGKILDW